MQMSLTKTKMSLTMSFMNDRSKSVSMYASIQLFMRKELAKKLSVSVKTIARALEQMPDVRYVGSGDKGHWIVD